jgi:hypothetical protein
MPDMVRRASLAICCGSGASFSAGRLIIYLSIDNLGLFGVALLQRWNTIAAKYLTQLFLRDPELDHRPKFFVQFILWADLRVLTTGLRP